MLKRAHKKRPISLTSLVDVSFIMLHYCMLPSTISKFAEVPLRAHVLVSLRRYAELSVSVLGSSCCAGLPAERKASRRLR